jgi:tRNA dimethylallyltransferase
MNIGTAKITSEQMCGIPHYMIDELEPDEEFHVYFFQKKVREYLADIYARGKIPILVGGTGFYIQSVLYDIQFTDEKSDETYRQQLRQEAERDGVESLHKKLASVDPDSAKTIHPNNVKRVIRALEYYHLTGKTFSSHNEEQKKRISPYNFAYFMLNTDRKILYERIDRRVDEMLESGLIEEVQSLLNQGYSRSLVSMQGLGYKEIAAALCGEYSMEEAVYILKRDTRHFAKRQLTWFRREKEICVIEKENYKTADELVSAIVQIAREKGVLL